MFRFLGLRSHDVAAAAFFRSFSTIFLYVWGITAMKVTQCIDYFKCVTSNMHAVKSEKKKTTTCAKWRTKRERRTQNESLNLNE